MSDLPAMLPGNQYAMDLKPRRCWRNSHPGDRCPAHVALDGDGEPETHGLCAFHLDEMRRHSRAAVSA